MWSSSQKEKMHLRNCHRAFMLLLMGLLLIAPACKKDNEPVSGGAANGKRPNIIVLTVDTLRADHMAVYGYHRDTMPAIEAFAKTAVVFDQAVVS
ncbi:MAG: sulfatase-like hydrolase/transferase, partial [Planctomycetota bacterium]